MSKKEIMTAATEGNDIVIKIPTALLVFTQKYRPDGGGYKIKDKTAMIKYIAENILTFEEDQEDGTTAIQGILDRLFDEAYECAEDWLEELNDEDED